MFVEPRDADKSVAADVAGAQLIVALVLLVLAERRIGVEHLQKKRRVKFKKLPHDCEPPRPFPNIRQKMKACNCELVKN
jgi:hypothetical protein